MAIPNLKPEAVIGPQACNVYFEAKKEAPQRMFATRAIIKPGFKFIVLAEKTPESRSLFESGIDSVFNVRLWFITAPSLKEAQKYNETSSTSSI